MKPLKHVRLFVRVPFIGKYCIIGKDLGNDELDLVAGSVTALNQVLHGVLLLEVTDTA